MIALIAAEIATGETDFAALSRAVAGCDRQVVGEAVTQEGQRHGAFLLGAYDEQRAIVADRAALAERRLKLRTPMPREEKAAKPVDSEAALALTMQALDDRQHALDDARLLDRLRQEMIGNFRQLYLSSCQARGK